MYPWGQIKLAGGPRRLARLLIWREATGVEATSVAVVVDGGNIVEDSGVPGRRALFPLDLTAVEVAAGTAVTIVDRGQNCGSLRTEN